MDDSKIIVHQAYYGEVNRAHSCIEQTITDPELNSFLIAFTDRPAALPPGTELKSYLSGVAFSAYYIFTKTFSDPFSSRAGMVFTHALILNKDEIQAINDLDNIFSIFFDEIPKVKPKLKILDVDTSENEADSNINIQPLFVQQVVTLLINGETPILFSGDTDSFKHVLQTIWNFPNTALRNKLKFRASFTPSDIQGVEDITIVSLQEEFLSKWSSKKIIYSEDNNLVNIESHSEAFILGARQEGPFYDFLADLNVNPNDFHDFCELDKIYSDYLELERTEDSNNLRHNIRRISIISPFEQDGKIIKNKFIGKLEELIKNGTDVNLKALRNIKWKAFQDGETNAQKIVSEFIGAELEKKNDAQVNILAELLNLSFNKGAKNWWHDAIQSSFKGKISSYTSIILNNLWKLLEYSKKTADNLFLIIPVTEKNEVNFGKSIPDSVNKETITILERVSKERNWYSLHAKVLLKYLEPNKAILKQLEVEKSLNLNDSIGVKYLIEKTSDKDLLASSLLNCDNKLVEMISERISTNKTLLNNIDLSNSCWRNIWSNSLDKTRSISYGLEGKEQDIVNYFLDLFVNGIYSNELTIELISDSIYADISNYKKRNECWSKLPEKFKDSFLNETSKAVATKLILDEIDFSSVESALADRISSDAFMSKFLYENKDKIEPVIKIHEIFTNLKDKFLSDYIRLFKPSISDSQSIRLGRVVNKSKFSESARSIYDKSQKNDSFNLALEKCQGLVALHWWESIFSGSINLFNEYPRPNFKRDDLERDKQVWKPLPLIVILTAIQEEYMAVKSHLKDINDVDKNDTTYEAGIFQLDGKDIANVIIRECGAKNTVASQETERAIQYFKPDCMLFVGIAGSRKPKDFKIGDVIFPEKIYSYEGGKSEKNSFKSRPDLASLSYTLKEIAKRERRKEDWKVLIKNEWNIEMKADLGVIASGEKLIEHYSSDIGDILTNHFNDTSAVEMEGFGFAKAAVSQGRETNKILVGVVRGISDVIVQPESDLAESHSDRRPDDAKKIASDTAAAFAYWLIYKAYENRNV